MVFSGVISQQILKTSQVFEHRRAPIAQHWALHSCSPIVLTSYFFSGPNNRGYSLHPESSSSPKTQLSKSRIWLEISREKVRQLEWEHGGLLVKSASYFQEEPNFS